MAKYTLHIVADSGYSSDTVGWCTPDQYGAAMASLHGKRTPLETELLEALRESLIFMEANTMGGDDTLASIQKAHAAIAKATGGST